MRHKLEESNLIIKIDHWIGSHWILTSLWIGLGFDIENQTLIGFDVVLFK